MIDGNKNSISLVKKICICLIIAFCMGIVVSEADVRDSNKSNSDTTKKTSVSKTEIVEPCQTSVGNGAISIVEYAEEKTTEASEKKQIQRKLVTHFVDEKNRTELNPYQVMERDYKNIATTYLTKYFNTIYSQKERSEQWEKYIEPSEQNLNTFFITPGSIDFYFDEGTVLKKDAGNIVVSMPRFTLENKIRKDILKRYVDPSKKMIALTYDDGPGGDTEKKILDCLEKTGTVATFFYYGAKVPNNPTQIKRAYELGCEIGNHTWSHPVLTKLKPEEVSDQISRCNEAIKNACGAYPTLFRPSYGITNDNVNSLANMPVIMWSIDTLDWTTDSPREVAEKITDNPNIDGSIVLMHSTKESSSIATESLIPWLLGRGYQLVTVTELITYKREVQPQADVVYK